MIGFQPGGSYITLPRTFENRYSGRFLSGTEQPAPLFSANLIELESSEKRRLRSILYEYDQFILDRERLAFFRRVVARDERYKFLLGRLPFNAPTSNSFLSACMSELVPQMPGGLKPLKPFLEQVLEEISLKPDDRAYVESLRAKY